MRSSLASSLGKATEIKAHDVPVVGAGFGGDVDGSAGAVAGFGFDAVDGDDGFLNGVGIGDVGVLLADAVGDAVDFKLVFQIGAAAEIDAVGGPGVVRLNLAAGIDGLRLDQGQLERVAVELRGVVGHLGVDGEFVIGVVELHFLGFGVYRDGLLQRAGIQDGIDGDVAAGLDLDAGLGKFGEAGRFDRDDVVSRLDEIEQVEAGIAGIAHGAYAGIDVHQCNDGVGDGGLGAVGDESADLRAIGLGEAANGERQEKRQGGGQRGRFSRGFHNFSLEDLSE